jgi:hypothetical protein
VEVGRGKLLGLGQVDQAEQEENDHARDQGPDVMRAAAGSSPVRGATTFDSRNRPCSRRASCTGVGVA